MAIYFDGSLFNNFAISECPSDGNCLFHAINSFLDVDYGVQEIREKVVEYVENNWGRLGSLCELQYYNDNDADVVRTSEDYVRVMGKNGVWAGELELLAASEVYKTAINVYYKDDPSRAPTVFGASFKDNNSINILYCQNHYSYLVDAQEVISRKLLGFWNIPGSGFYYSSPLSQLENVNESDSCPDQIVADQIHGLEIKRPRIGKLGTVKTNEETEEQRTKRLERRNQARRRKKNSEDVEEEKEEEFAGDERRLKRRRVIYAARKEAETEEEKNLRLEKRRKSATARKEALTEEQKNLRLEERRKSATARKEALTEEQKNLRLEKRRKSATARREALTEEQKNLRLEQQRNSATAIREAATEEQTNLRLEQHRNTKADRREAETKEQKRRRLDKRKEAVRVLKENSLKKTYRIAYIPDNMIIECDPLNIGDLSVSCLCGSKFFPCEVSSKKPPFQRCCKKGKVKLEHFPDFPDDLKTLFMNSKFRDQIRSYNSALAFASMSAPIVPQSRGPYCFKIHNQFYHAVSGIPSNNPNPKFAQLYVIDTRQAMNYRQANNDMKLDETVLLDLDKLIREINPYAHAFRMLKQVFDEECQRLEDLGGEMPDVHLWLTKGKLSHSAMYQTAKSNEIAMIFRSSCSDGGPSAERDVVVHANDGTLQKISILSKHLDPMSYVLFFPHGERGWSPDLQITLMEFYAFMISFKDGFNPVLSGGNLTQQYIVDAECKREENNLNFIRTHQKQLRVELYAGLSDYIHSRAKDKNIPAGKMVILPSSFGNGPRSMVNRYLNAMSVVQKFGKPDLFVTMTCNPRWPEILRNLRPFEKPHDRPDLLVRVFHMYFTEFLRDMTQNRVLGKVAGYIYVVEFQKLGLPHVHMLLINTREDKIRNGDDVNKIVSAELPDPENTVLFNLVTQHMLHGPCGPSNPKCVCMVENKCSKKYPKDFRETTAIDCDGYPGYRRRNDGKVFLKRVKGCNHVMDNQWVVPYNPYLLLKYQCHINVEICSTVKSVKYLYLYVYKGHDTANVEIQQNEVTQLDWDEIKFFLDARFITAPEAAFRIFEFPMHGNSHTIVTLAVHLPEEQPVYFEPGNELRALIQSELRNTTLTAFFNLNQADVRAHEFTYLEIPEHYVYVKKSGSHWKDRERGGEKVIARMYTVSPMQTERFYLRLLLLHVRGPKSFADVRTVNGVVCDTFHEAARLRNLILDDTEWDKCLQEAVAFRLPRQLRELFALICVHCAPSNPLDLWMKYKNDMMEDFLHMGMSISEAESSCLEQILGILQNYGKSLSSFNLPTDISNVPHPNLSQVFDDSGNITVNELDTNRQTLNHEQISVYDYVINLIDGAIDNKLIFLEGPGGCGKSYLYSLFIKYLKHHGKYASVVAWTGIAAILLEGGCTVHSEFGLPVPLLENSTCSHRLQSKAAHKIKEAHMIIWDEVTMAPKYAFTAIDRFLKDLMNNNEPFGGKICIFGGDFRQCLPILKHGSRLDILELCIKNSIFWEILKPMRLHQNMRTVSNNDHSNWLVDLGDGKLNEEINGQKDCVVLPNSFITESCLVDEIFGEEILQNTVINERVILAPTNDDVDHINEKVLAKVPGSSKCYLSVDKLESESDEQIYPLEFVNSLTPSGMPPHKLTFKIGAVVMLLRNLDITNGLCNGTRLIVMAMGENLIQCKLVSGAYSGRVVFIPRITFQSSEAEIPFKFARRQFPLKLAYSITINKSQGQSLSHVGILLVRPVFSHGQLYVAFSRCKTPENIKVFICKGREQGQTADGRWFTKNIVFREVLE